MAGLPWTIAHCCGKSTPKPATSKMVAVKFIPTIIMCTCYASPLPIPAWTTCESRRAANRLYAPGPTCNASVLAGLPQAAVHLVCRTSFLRPSACLICKVGLRAYAFGARPHLELPSRQQTDWPIPTNEAEPANRRCLTPLHKSTFRPTTARMLAELVDYLRYRLGSAEAELQDSGNTTKSMTLRLTAMPPGRPCASPVMHGRRPSIPTGWKPWTTAWKPT